MAGVGVGIFVNTLVANLIFLQQHTLDEVQVIIQDFWSSLSRPRLYIHLCIYCFRVALHHLGALDSGEIRDGDICRMGHNRIEKGNIDALILSTR